MKSLDQQSKAQTYQVDELRVQKMKERNKISVYEKDFRKVRSSD